jgi:hypothetical protein
MHKAHYTAAFINYITVDDKFNYTVYVTAVLQKMNFLPITIIHLDSVVSIYVFQYI